MADKFVVQMGEEDYRIVGPDGEEGAMVAYGTVATLSIEDAVYYSLVEDPDDEHPEVYRVDTVSRMPTEMEECDFPAEVVKAARALEAAIESTEGEVIDVEADAPKVN